jgi:predicted nucleotidyltransferase component of viral defense system
MLYWNTVSDLLKNCLLTLMQAEELESFRLVGGTALSLHLGHRMSVDIDLFSDADYGSVDFIAIEQMLQHSFNYVSGDFGGNPGMGKSYLIGNNEDDVIKLGIYYSMDPFFQGVVDEDKIRLASIEEIIAMKTDIIQRTGRKKDFWDLHELSAKYSMDDMIKFHEHRFEWTHEAQVIRNNFTQFEEADQEPDPICLRGKQWVFIKEDLEEWADDSHA